MMNYISPEDVKIIDSVDWLALMDEYQRKFGVDFPLFSYQEFRSDGIRPAGQVYIDTLQEALKSNKPYQCKTKWRTVDEILAEHGLLDK